MGVRLGLEGWVRLGLQVRLGLHPPGRGVKKSGFKKFPFSKKSGFKKVPFSKKSGFKKFPFSKKSGFGLGSKVFHRFSALNPTPRKPAWFEIF